MNEGVARIEERYSQIDQWPDVQNVVLIDEFLDMIILTMIWSFY